MVNSNTSFKYVDGLVVLPPKTMTYFSWYTVNVCPDRIKLKEVAVSVTLLLLFSKVTGRMDHRNVSETIIQTE